MRFPEAFIFRKLDYREIFKIPFEAVNFSRDYKHNFLASPAAIEGFA